MVDTKHVLIRILSVGERDTGSTEFNQAAICTGYWICPQRDSGRIGQPIQAFPSCKVQIDPWVSSRWKKLAKARLTVSRWNEKRRGVVGGSKTVEEHTGKEESLVFLNRPTNGAAENIVCEHRGFLQSCHSFVVGQGIQGVRSEQPASCAMKLI